MSPLLGRPTTPEAPHPAPAPEAGAPRRSRRRGPRGIRPLVASLIAVVMLVAVALSTPVIRDELRQSFSPTPSRYTELYFTQAPTVVRNTAVVPVSLVDHGADEGTQRLRVWLESAGDRVTASTTIRVTPRDDSPTSTEARLPLRGESVVVHVSLLGSDQSLHFRLGTGGIPTPESTP